MSAAYHECGAESIEFAGARVVRDPGVLGGLYQQAHVREVRGILFQSPLVPGTGLGAHQGIRSPFALGLVEQVEAVAVDGLVDVPPQFLA